MTNFNNNPSNLNNYFQIDTLLFRLVRINGDGTIRIALNGSAGTSKSNISRNDNYNSCYN